MRAPFPLAPAVQAALVTFVVGGLGLAMGQPWIFPSIGPTAVLQAQPQAGPAARPWNALAGHGCGIVSGCIGVVVVGARHTPGVLASGQVTGARVAAAAVAVVLVTALMEISRARHMPAAATAMLFAEGSYRATAHDVVLVAMGVMLTVALGEALRSLRRTAAR